MFGKALFGHVISSELLGEDLRACHLGRETSPTMKPRG